MSEYPFKYEGLDEEINEAIKKDFLGYTRGMMKVTPFDLFMPPEFKNYGERIYNMEVKPDDLWLVTFAKAGTTWTQAAIWSIINDGKLELLKDNPLLNNWNFLELDVIAKDGNARLMEEELIPEKHWPTIQKMSHQFDSIVSAQSPRFIKTHLPFPFLPPNLLDTTKIVYIARNPKDVCVSYFHHHKLIRSHDFQGDFPLFFDYFIKDQVLFSPYWPHVIDAWSRRHHPNMLFMFYEDMKKDFGAALRKLGNFLGKPVSDQLVEKLLVELSVEGMKRNPAFNVEFLKEMELFNKDGNFIRKGIVGDWKNHFTPDMEKRMNEWSHKQRQGCDIKFPGEQ